MDGPYLDGLPPGSSYPASAALSYTLPPSATVDIADLDDAFIVSQSQLSQSSLSAKEWSHEVCPALMNNAGSGSMPVSPPVSNDDFDSSNYHASSTTLAGTEPPFSFLASPRSCSESDLFQWIDQNQVQSRSLTPLSLDGSPASQDVITSHHTGFTSDPSVTGRADPRGLSPRSSTAASRPPVTHAGDPFETTMSPASVDDEHEGKADPPYAQLIYEFFMNHGDPRRGVPLRAIYDYFREHTTKCSNGGKGWQNSIRHNLSMNEVGKIA